MHELQPCGFLLGNGVKIQFADNLSASSYAIHVTLLKRQRTIILRCDITTAVKLLDIRAFVLPSFDDPKNVSRKKLQIDRIHLSYAGLLVLPLTNEST